MTSFRRIDRRRVATVLFVTVGMGSSIALEAFAASIIGGFGDVSGAPRAATRFLVSSAMS
jgi:branched-subunit amino acid ABC-type transport system permease component